MSAFGFKVCLFACDFRKYKYVQTNNTELLQKTEMQAQNEKFEALGLVWKM